MKIALRILSAAVLLNLLLFWGCSKAGSSDLNWYTNLNQAMKVAQKENRAVLVDFTGSDWCVWCKRLNNEVFSQKPFVKYANSNLVLVKIDFPEKIKQSSETIFYNRQLAQKFGVQGFPTIFLLNTKGQIIAQTGYQQGGAQAYVQHLKSLIM